MKDVAEDRVLLHYVGGGTEEVEWIAKDSNRLRPVSEEHNGLDAAGGAAQSSSDRGGDHDSSESAQDSAPHRPMRRSRIEADDAKLAKQLQEEELRSHRAGARKRPLPAAKKSPATTRAPAARSTSRGSATSRGGGRSVAAKSPSKASTAAAKASSQPPVKSARVSSSEKSVLFELVYDLALAPSDNVSESPGFEPILKCYTGNATGSNSASA